MNLRQLAKWALDKGVLIFEGEEKTENVLDIIERIALVGPTKAYRWATVWGITPVFVWMMRSLTKQLRVVSAKPRQVGVIIFGSEPSHPASLGSTLELFHYAGEAVREGHLVFDRGTHAEIYAA